MYMFYRFWALLLFSLYIPTISFALTGEGNTKKVPIDFHVDHPDHVPHNNWKNPVKNTGHDDGVFPRKRKEWEEEGESE